MKKTAIFVLVIFIAVSIAACSFSVSTASLKNLQMASQVDGSNKAVNVTDTFENDTPVIYATGTVDSAPGGTVIEALWVYVESAPPIDIDSVEMTINDSDVDFVFSLSKPDNGWPSGKYEVRFSIDGVYKESLYFTVP